MLALRTAKVLRKYHIIGCNNMFYNTRGYVIKHKTIAQGKCQNDTKT